ncbi:MAG: Crp/Fnr family transcriptional regulator [Tepidanaerobacteraceae bacterium]|jgi:CRP-like cAMP-binding protein|nr:Crp/Fnr family transcriptional regulator [Tepidanaerobacteraceae bacterium]
MYEKIAESLNSPLFAGISGEERVSLLNCLNPKIASYKKNDYIIIAGDKFDSVGILLEGEATVVKENAAGNRTMMTLLKPGDIFGEIVAFSKQSVWPATVQAQEACMAMFLAREKIVGECKKVCPWHNMLIQNMLRILSDKALMLNRKVEYMTIVGIREKICTFLLEQYKKAGKTTFMLPMNRKEMAEFLNVSRPSLSREMCRMRDDGIIDFHMATVKILDPDGLKKNAG